MERRRGRKKGEKVGEGSVQLFVKRRGGRRFLKLLYREFQSADAIAEFIYSRYNFFCSGNTIRNIMRRYHIPLNPAGGDRRSPARRAFSQGRIRKAGHVSGEEEAPEK
ncbi:hypothetical protein ACFL6L_03810 [candidate division KSB1 bacterium]